MFYIKRGLEKRKWGRKSILFRNMKVLGSRKKGYMFDLDSSFWGYLIEQGTLLVVFR